MQEREMGVMGCLQAVLVFSGPALASLCVSCASGATWVGLPHGDEHLT